MSRREQRVILTAKPRWRRQLLRRITALGPALAIIGAQLGVPHHGKVIWAPDRDGQPAEVLWVSRDPHATPPDWLSHIECFFLTSVFLTDTTGTASWVAPGNIIGTGTVEGIGGGGGGAYGGNGVGGGAGAYAKNTGVTLTSGTFYPYVAGKAGIGGIFGQPHSGGTDGGITNFNTGALIADSGKAGAGTGFNGQGGQASASTGGTKSSGGNGGTNPNGSGGGAAGPNGAGSNGAPNSAGGAADNSTVTGGPINTNGNTGTEFDASHGSGSGGGSPANNAGGTPGAGGLYGGGGAAGNTLTTGPGANGAQGIIVITFVQAQLTFRAVTGSVQASGATSITVNDPTSGALNANDILTCGIWLIDPVANAPRFSAPPSGWTQLVDGAASPDQSRLGVFWYRAAGGGSDPTSWVFNYSDGSAAAAYSVRADAGAITSGSPFVSSGAQTGANSLGVGSPNISGFNVADFVFSFQGNSGFGTFNGLNYDRTQTKLSVTTPFILRDFRSISGTISLWDYQQSPTTGGAISTPSQSQQSANPNNTAWAVLRAQGVAAGSQSGMSRSKQVYYKGGTTNQKTIGAQYPLKIYFEAQILAMSYPSGVALGIVVNGTSVFIGPPPLTNAPDGIGGALIYALGASRDQNGTHMLGVSAAMPPAVVGDTLCFAWDNRSSVNNYWVKIIHNGVSTPWNGDNAADPVNNINGRSASSADTFSVGAPICACVLVSTAGDQVIVNFGGPTPFAGQIPTGYTSWSTTGVPLAVDARMPSEERATLLVDAGTMPGEIVVSVVNDEQIPSEELATVRTDAVLPDEALSTARVDGALPSEALSVVRTDETIPSEALITVTKDSQAPSEFLSSKRTDGTIPSEVISTVRTDAALPSEALLTFRNDSSLPSETVHAVVYDDRLPAESLIVVRNDTVIPIENLGIVIVTMDCVMALEFGSFVSSSSSMPSEASKVVRQDTVQPSEALRQVTRDSPVLSEYLGPVVSDIFLKSMFLSTMDARSSMPTESGRFVFSDEVMPLELARTILTDAPITSEFFALPRVLAKFSARLFGFNRTAIVGVPSRTAILPKPLRTALGVLMPQAPDLSPFDPQDEITAAFDFGNYMPPGITISGTPTITCAVFKGRDPNPSSRITGPLSIGTQPKSQNGSGIAGMAVFQSFGPGCIGGVVYTFQCVATGSDGKPYSIWVHAPCTAVT